MARGRGVLRDLRQRTCTSSSGDSDRGTEKADIGPADSVRQGERTHFDDDYAPHLTLGFKPNPLPKYTNAILARQFKQTPYWRLADAYPKTVPELQAIVSKEQETISRVRAL